MDVDHEALDGLGRRLAGVQAQLDGLGADLGAFDEAVGSRRLTKRLSEMVANWQHHRQRLLGEVKELSDLATGAAATYASTDSGLGASFRNGPAPGAVAMGPPAPVGGAAGAG